MLPHIQNPDTYLQTIVSEANTIKHLTGFSHLKLRSPSGTISLKAAVLVQVPASLRVEAFSLFNQMLLLIATDGRVSNIFYPDQNILYRGETINNELSVLFGTDLSSSDAVCFLRGFPPLSEYDPSAITMHQEGSCYGMVLPSTHHTPAQHLLIDPKLNRIVKYQRTGTEESPAWECSFSDFQSIAGILIPLKIDLTFTASKTRIIITYQTVDTVQPVSSELFYFKPPSGARIVPLTDVSKTH